MPRKFSTSQMMDIIALIADSDRTVKDDRTAFLKRVMDQMVEDGLADVHPIGWLLRGERQPLERRIVRFGDGKEQDLSEGGTI